MGHGPPPLLKFKPRAQKDQILLGLIGENIAPSRTPYMHMREAALQELNVRYDLFDISALGIKVDDLSRLMNDIEEAGYAGVNVTHPCKQAIIPLLHELSPEAKILRAVNTVLFKNGRRVGHNTDWSGFYESFKRRLQGVDMTHALQIGAGGAGSAVAYALLRLGLSKLSVFDNDYSRAQALAEHYKPLFPAASIEAADTIEEVIKSATGLVNCTPMGMASYPGLPLPSGFLRANQWVSEIVYFPLETALIKAARAIGCKTSDGSGMAVFQAVAAFRLFMNQEPDAERMMASFAA